ncbi:hypothetical protein BJ322DRAFT_522135 [Thelephora terrestris]|uniref:Helitron helicase-like domain-containing protein n=1 Tax=Thelephora terrestris TaxID=56493 RepID=A0A9P6H4A9_9AGAM|nr:hypothetical protein BJ322DRAFT_522135 [Thelephora terrestris]
MSDSVPLTPRSRRRHALRLGRESDDREGQRRTPSFGLQTPPHTTLQTHQNEHGPSGSSQQRRQVSTNRSEGQRRRRERERREREQQEQQLTLTLSPPGAPLPTPPSTQNSRTNHQVPPGQGQQASSNRSEGQRRRRERERHERQQQQHQPVLAPMPPRTPLPTPLSTHGSGTNRRVLPVARRPYREPTQRHDLGRMEHACPHCGALHWLFERSTGSGSSDAHPLFSMCCNSGDIKLPPMAPPPTGLHHLFTAATPQAERFRQHIRQYNAALAFTSLGVEVDNSVNQGGGGPPVFRIHGELRHQLGSLFPRRGDRPSYAQLYIYDPHEALDHRMQRNTTLDPIVMEYLQNLILTNHRWAQIFKHAMEVFDSSGCEDVSIQLTANKNRDRRRWNLPTADEVAVVIPGSKKGKTQCIPAKISAPKGGRNNNTVDRRADGPGHMER